MADLDAVAGDVRVRIEGVRRLTRALTEAGVQVEDQKDLMHAVGMTVVRRAAPPVGPTGRTGSSLRAGRGKTKAVVRAGYRNLRYVPVIHWGWPARNIKRNPWLQQADQSARPDAINTYQDGVNALLDKHF